MHAQTMSDRPHWTALGPPAEDSLPRRHSLLSRIFNLGDSGKIYSSGGSGTPHDNGVSGIKIYFQTHAFSAN